MFRQLTSSNPAQATALFDRHPQEIAALLEGAWRDRILPSPFGENTTFLAQFPALAPGSLAMPFEHLVYAYMIENTRVYDIFRRVASEYAQGERLEIPSAAGQRWLRTTEELFFGHPPGFLSFTLASPLRPDPDANRRNVYFRLLGLDLNHGNDVGKPYVYVKPAAANREFIPTLELLLTEVWRGITNSTNTSGPRDTDNDAIATLATRLRDMLTVRRLNGNLGREEFWYTAMMAWFHLTLEFDSPIVVDLKGNATSPEERLRKIGDRVGLPSHDKSQAFFQLAEALSLFLREIEQGHYTTPATAPLLYNMPVAENMIRIVTQYSIATGRDIKAKTVTVQRREVQRLPQAVRM